MNKNIVSLIAAVGMLSSFAVYSENHTLSLGYAQSSVQDFKNIVGVNAQYRYEWDSPVSILGSFTYMSGKDNIRENDLAFKADVDLEYWSLLVGPSYRFNDLISTYVLAGIANTKVKSDLSFFDLHVRDSSSNTDFAYGVGFIINPVEQVAINFGYEGSRAHVANDKVNINGFNIGIGYRF